MSRPRQLNKQWTRRRQLIFRRVVLDNRPLSIKELQGLLNDKSYNEAKAQRDVDEFKAVGCAIALNRSPKDSSDKQFVFLEGPHTDDDTIREGINPEGKKLAARLAATVVCGFSTCTDASRLPAWMNDPAARVALDGLANRPESETAVRVQAVLRHLEERVNAQHGEWALGSTDDILTLLKQSETFLDARQKTLRTNLHAFWGEAYRLVALDSGTTNLIVARYLKELRLPVPGSRLCSLAVCTNSRRIFAELGPAEVSVKTIIIGGQQKFHSPAIAGSMAELFLRTASILQFGVCVLGATKVDIERFAICSDSQEEASIKNLLMEKSSLRIICVDDSKLQTGPGREGYKFASIDPMQIDLIITNSPFRGEKTADEFEDFKRKVRAIEGRGVPVLIATSPQATYGHPIIGQDPGSAVKAPIQTKKRRLGASPGAAGL